MKLPVLKTWLYPFDVLGNDCVDLVKKVEGEDMVFKLLGLYATEAARETR